MRHIKLAVLIATLSLAWASGASAATLEPVGSFDQPIYVTSDPDDPDRLFVVEREGRIMLVDGFGASLFGELESLVRCCEGERGLHSIALAPDFPTSERFYAAYTGTLAAGTDVGGTVGDIYVDAFRPGPGGEGELLREPILHIDHDDFANHHGGQLQFGPDGYLYIAPGDGGGGGDPLEEAGNLEALHGKILRIEPTPEGEDPYVAPADNPFFGAVPGADEIWAYGLRNPWRFSFDRDSDDMIVADVGQSQREEIDFAPSPAAGVVGGRGANYGWNCREGLIAYVSPADYCDGAGGFTDPVFDYPHENPGGGPDRCSITGGYVVRDPAVTDLFGRYVYTDFCDGEIRSLVMPGPGEETATGDRSEHLTVAKPVSFGEDSSGRVYVVSQDGNVYRLIPSVRPEQPTTPSPGDPPPDANGSTPAADTNPGGLPERPAPQPQRVRLEAERSSGADSRLFRLIVHVEPCGRLVGTTVRLNRGGRPSGTKPLSRGCVARFQRRVADRATFRALLFVGGIALRSPRLVLNAAD